MKLFRNRTLTGFIVFFGLLYALISLVNHYTFRTYALDLGLYTNALYDYAHLQWNDSTVFKEVAVNLLSDHFDLYLIIFSPFGFIFQTYTLLIIQIIFVLIGGIGVYQYLMFTNNNSRLALSGSIYFWTFFGVFSAIAYDYHSNVIAATLVPWFLLNLKKSRFIRALLLLTGIVIAKENMSFFMAFVCLGLAIEYRKNVPARNYLIFSGISCLILFVIITSWIMPSIEGVTGYPNFKYHILGNNFGEAFMNLIKHPVHSFKAFFTNHTGHPSGDYVKAEFLVMLLCTGLPLLIFRPQWLIMLIPVAFQKLFHDNYVIWGFSGQYAIEFAPLLAIGVFESVGMIKAEKWKNRITALVVILSIATTIRSMDKTVLFTNKSMIRFYKSSHYSRDYDIKQVHVQLKQLPSNVLISAQAPFLPHLAWADTIYQFPIIKEARYILYSKKEESYPLSSAEFTQITDSLEHSNHWGVIYNQDEFVILKRK